MSDHLRLLFMRHSVCLFPLFLILLICFSACEKWTDTPAKDLGLTNKYCNIPSAINYNHGFPGIEDNAVCIFPATPFAGLYSFQDSIYDNADQLFLGDLLTLNIAALDSTRFTLQGFCANSNIIHFTANKYYRAITDSIIGQGTQYFCRDLDTLSGNVEYNIADSSLMIELQVVSDTSVITHKGRAYKK